MTTAERIKAARKNAGLTQKQLADKLGISPVGITQWETGVRKPKAETLKRLADALDVPIMELDERFAYHPGADVSIVAPEEDDLRDEVKDLTYSLNRAGLCKTRDYMRDLMCNPEYCPPKQKSDSE